MLIVPHAAGDVKYPDIRQDAFLTVGALSIVH
jgi:hypothetical protein